MILREQSRVDILQEAKRDALIRAKVWSDIAGYLESLLDEEHNENAGPLNRTIYDDDGVQFTYTSVIGQSDDLPRSGPRRDDKVRYNRGSKASDEGPLR